MDKLVLASALILILFASVLASANPTLHGWLHADHQSPSHYCLVSALEQGHNDAGGVTDPVTPAPAPSFVSALPFESFFVTHTLALHSERGPPVGS